jgi:FAD:protein FMN transferase
MITSASWAALGTTASVFVTETASIVTARELLRDELERIDRACSRFRTDSTLATVNRSAGEPVPVDDLLLEAVEVAIRVARATDGAVDPTVGRAIRESGYDRDFDELEPNGRAPAAPSPSPGWKRVTVDRLAGTVRVPPGCELDLGASAKALAADRAARRIGEHLRCGVLVNLGGDVAIAGPPPDGGWRVRVCDDHANPSAGPGQTVAIPAGGLATSSTTVRRWSAGGVELHHIIDPRTGGSAQVTWRTVTVTAGSCVDANAASTASIVRGSGAPEWLENLGLPSRLVAPDGTVLEVAGWPREGRP